MDATVDSKTQARWLVVSAQVLCLQDVWARFCATMRPPDGPAEVPHMPANARLRIPSQPAAIWLEFASPTASTHLVINFHKADLSKLYQRLHAGFPHAECRGLCKEHHQAGNGDGADESSDDVATLPLLLLKSQCWL